MCGIAHRRSELPPRLGFCEGECEPNVTRREATMTMDGMIVFTAVTLFVMLIAIVPLLVIDSH